jgi:hypothetical protein
MDGYLSKPIDVGLLLATVEHINQKAPGSSSAAGAASPPAAVSLDLEKALTHTGGDRRLLKGARGAVPRGCAGVAAQDRTRGPCR